MKLLTEGNDIFGANQLQLVQKIYKQSSINGVSTKGNDEKQLVKSILGRFGVKRNGAPAYLCIKAASFGSNDEQNHCLAYLRTITDGNNVDLLKKHPAKVNVAMDLISSGEIETYKDRFLKEPSLYSRSNNEFDYTLKAFDAVMYKKDKYFDHNNGMVKVSLEKETLEKFFGEDVRQDDSYAQEDEFDFDLDESLLKEELYSAQVPISEKYFFENKSYSGYGGGKIIPAGLGGGNTNQRTIWNYMEIWTTFTEDSEQQRLRDKDDMKDKAKEIIKNSRMTDEEKRDLNSLIGRM